MSLLLAVLALVGLLVPGPAEASAAHARALGPPPTWSHSGAAPPAATAAPAAQWAFAPPAGSADTVGPPLAPAAAPSPTTAHSGKPSEPDARPPLAPRTNAADAVPPPFAPAAQSSRTPHAAEARAGSPPAAVAHRSRTPPAGWVYPVGPPGGPVEVVHGFDPPDQPWLAGHRGVDLAATAGAEVRAAGPGTVAYAGPLAGRGVVVIDHGGLRTTYEPVTASVNLGDAVGAGQPIGTLEAAGSHCAPAACLHWGAREGERYTDPLALAGAGPVRLLPLGARTLTGDPPPPPRPQPPPSSAGLAWPVVHPRVTSPYGLRVHPITGERKLHDGADLAAGCGTPIRAAAAGRVTDAGERGPYGRQITIDHGRVRGTPLTTSYSHLSAFSVAAGQPVGARQVVGRAGSTGLSTGCHLHFMLYAAGRVTDPIPWLPGSSPAATSYLAKALREGYRR